MNSAGIGIIGDVSNPEQCRYRHDQFCIMMLPAIMYYLITKRASIIPSDNIRGCQSGSTYVRGLLPLDRKRSEEHLQQQQQDGLSSSEERQKQEMQRKKLLQQQGMRIEAR